MASEPRSPHERFNFNLRPSKRIERKLVAEVLTCIHRYDSPRRFAYVGMGSLSFADFVLFHRLFGIDEMVSIETDQESKDRFEFNRPYACIKMVWGTTYDKLPGLETFSRKPVICWLDYYDRLNASIIGDLRTFLTRAKVGSAFLITLKAAPFSSNRANPDNSVETFIKGLPEKLRDERHTQRELLRKGPKGIGEYMLDVMTAAIQSMLLDVNSGSKNALKMRQIVNIFYKDATPMVTFGWLLLDAQREAALNADPVSLDAAGVNATRKSTEVIAPVLTFREIQHLRANLPSAAANFEELAKPVPTSDAKRFADLYRFFPSFADVEE